MPKHSPFGGSKIGLISMCPGSYAMSLGIDDVDSPVMEWGRKMHAALEPGGEQPEDEFDRDLIAWVQERRLEMVETYLQGRPDWEEYELHLGPLRLMVPSHAQPFSTLDYLAVRGHVGYLDDAKFGYNPLGERHISGQAILYAMLAFQEYPRLKTLHASVSHAPHRELHYAVFRREDRAKYHKELEVLIQTALSPGAPFHPSAEACGRCKGATRCMYPQREIARIERLPAISDLAPAERSLLLEKMRTARSIAEAMIQQIRDHAIENPDSVPGFRVVECTKARATEPMARYLEGCGEHVDPDEFRRLLAEEIKPTVGALERVWRKLNPGLQRKEVRAEVRAVFQTMLEETQEASLRKAYKDQ